MTRPTPKAFADLLQSAVQEPGILSRAYSQFHSYSLGNQLLAMMQCHQRGIEPGPMATFPGWKALGRHVRKGEKALTLCMCQGRSKIRPPWRRKTRPLGSWVEWRNAAVRRGRQDAGVAAGWRAFLLCSRR